MRNKTTIEELDNRDSNETEIHLKDGITTLCVDFEDAIDILFSFIKNADTKEARELVDRFGSRFDFEVKEYLV